MEAVGCQCSAFLFPPGSAAQRFIDELMSFPLPLFPLHPIDPDLIKPSSTLEKPVLVVVEDTEDAGKAMLWHLKDQLLLSHRAVTAKAPKQCGYC